MLHCRNVGVRPIKKSRKVELRRPDSTFLSLPERASRGSPQCGTLSPFLLAIPPYPFFQNLGRPAESREEAMKVAEQEISANPHFVVAVALTRISYADDVANVRSYPNPYFVVIVSSNWTLKFPFQRPGSFWAIEHIIVQ